jgi:diguanylate cyclase (GGDEF)-like protein
MDYGTFFFTNIASVTVFAVCIGVLAWYDRRATGMLWFAGAQLVGLAKLILQGLEGKVPAFLGTLTANELYLISFLMQWMGLHWFVVRKPLRSKWSWIAVGFLLVCYTGAYAFRMPYIANLINVPFVVVCGVSAWMLWTHAKEPFTAVARVAAAVVAMQMVVAAYRAVLTNMHYIHPRETVNAHTDPAWLYSLAVASFLAACMSMCEMWFLVTELQGELALRARTDPLTGALNRRSMEEAALRETARSLRYGNALSMIVLDIDNFKRLNDTLGHAAGDCALQAMVRRLNCMLRQQDSLARMGGEEFAILLPDTSCSAAVTIAERVRQGIADLDIRFDTDLIRMTICAGVAQFDPACNWEEMMRRADGAMYAAKRRGRNCVSARPEPDGPPIDKPGSSNIDSFKLLPSA